MPTWPEIQGYARSKYKLSRDHDDHFALIFAYGDDPSGRAQEVHVRSFNAFNKEWLEFASACCAAHEMSPTVALTKNVQFAVGALALDGPPESQVYVFRYTVPLDTMDLDEFELPLHVVASTADQLESQFAASDKF